MIFSEKSAIFRDHALAALLSDDLHQRHEILELTRRKRIHAARTNSVIATDATPA